MFSFHPPCPPMAMDQGQQGPLSWPDTPWEVLGLIVGRLPTLADRFRFGAVCRPWHAAEQQLQRPRQLPWLALSLPSSPTADRASFYSLSDKCVYQLPFPAGGSVCAGLAGSMDDWLVVAHRERGNFLVNPFTGATLPLPHQRTITRSRYLPDYSKLVEYYPPRNQREPYVRKVVLSCAPSVAVDDPGRCIVAAIVDSGELFFCRAGQTSWRRPRMVNFERIHDPFDDITFCNGRLYGIINSGTLGRASDTMRVFDVDEDADLLVESMNDGGFLHKHPEYEEEEQGEPNLHRRSYLDPDLERRYCVESGGRLLMIERYCWRYSRSGVRRTSMFKVFSRVPVQTEGYTYDPPFEAWVELESLDGEVLFVGGGGARSFAASEHDVDADCVYFTDDHCEREDKNISVGSESDNWIIDDPAETQPCRDIGRYRMRDKSIAFLDEELPSNERRSPPVWLYLSDRRR